MKVILDTNVIISSIFFGGIPSHIIEACYEKCIKLVMSPAILIEYRDVAERLARRKPNDYKTVLEWILTNAEMVADTTLAEPVSVDPDDDKFIAAALLSGAKIICSGDKHLLDVNGYRGIEILKPKPFADKYL